MAFRFRSDSKKEFERLGYSDLQCDEESVQPQQGFPPIKTVPYPESMWDKALWPQNLSKQSKKLIMKGRAKEKFLLTDKDLEDLVYLYVQAGKYMSKKFLYRQVERRAWEKYGGPTGWQAAAKAGYTYLLMKGGLARGGLSRRGERAPPAPPRNNSQIVPTTVPTPFLASGAAPAIQVEETIPATPRKRGKLLRLNTHPTRPISAGFVQDNVAGPSVPFHAQISARQSLFGSLPSLSTSTRSISSQQLNDYRSPSTAISALDNFVAKSPAASPAKRQRESEQGPSTPRLKRPRLFMIDQDDDDELPPRSPTPLSSPVKRMAPLTPTPLTLSPKREIPYTPKPSPSPLSSQKPSDVLELTGSEEDDYVPMELITPKKAKGVSPKKQFAVVCDDVVVEISD